MVVFESVDFFWRVVPPAEYWGVTPFLAFRYQHLCLVAYEDLTHHWPLLPMPEMGLEMPPPWLAEDGNDFDASVFHPGWLQCTNEGPSVV